MVGEIDLGIDELSDFHVIGRGGFSTIYSAHDGGFNRRVAVKLLHSLDDAGRRRFDRERGIMGQLSSHPNVIMPFRAGYTSTGAPYLVMELVEGGSLQELVDQRGALPWNEAVELILPITAALAHSHDQGILHRDLKPANIVLSGRVPKLTDFGIAAIRESTTTQVAYTLAHCPPEAFASGEDVRDERSDLYSIASTLHNLIVGRPPYHIDSSDSPHAYMFRIMEQPVPQVPGHLAPEPLRAFLQASMAKDPAHRPQTAHHFEQQLRAIHSIYGPTLSPGSHAGAVTTGSPPHPAAFSGPATSGPGQWAPPVISGPGPGTSGSGPGFGTSGSGTSGSGTSGPTPSFPATSDPGQWPPGGSGPVHSAPTRSFPPGTGDHELIGTPPLRRRSRGPILTAVGAVALIMALAAGGGLWLMTQGADDGPPDVVWRFETGSSLASRPAVSGETLVIGAHVTDTVHAIDTETGEQRWAFEAGGSVDAGPAIADDVVYIGSLDGIFHAIDLDTGELVWDMDLDEPVTGGAHVVATGTSSTTVVVGTGASIWGLAGDTGEPVWSIPVGATTNSTPATVLREGRPLVAVGATNGIIYLIDAASGEHDQIQLEGGIWFSQPLVLDRPGSGGQEIWIGSSLQDRGFLNRVEVDTGDVDTFANQAGVGTAPALSNEGHIIAGNDAGEVFAVDRVTLGEAWRQGYADSTQVKGSPAIHNDEIIFGTHDNELIAVDDTTGDEIWIFEGEQIFGLSAPVVVDDRLYVGNDSGAVYRFDLG